MPKAQGLYYESYADHQPETVILLHGFMGTHADWADVSLALAEHFRVIAIDLPGHGESRLIEDQPFCDLRHTASAIVGLVSSLGLNKISLVGYSMGGRIALYLALLFPERVRRLVMESATPGLSSEDERLQRRALDTALSIELETGDFADVVRRWYAQPLFETLRQRPDFEAIVQRRLANDPKQLAQALRHLSLGAQPNLWPALARHSTPSLALAGALDQKFTIIAKTMGALCPAIRPQIVPDCGHNVHQENADEFISLVREFLTTA